LTVPTYNEKHYFLVILSNVYLTSKFNINFTDIWILAIVSHWKYNLYYYR